MTVKTLDAKKGRDLKAALREVSLSEATLDAIEAQVKNREAYVAKAPELWKDEAPLE